MPRNLADYEEDFYAWTVEQARLLRSGEFSSIDIANVAEEIESLGRSDKREILQPTDRVAYPSSQMASAVSHEIE